MGKQQNIATYQAKLAQYIKLGSVSAQYQHIQETAQFLKQVFTELGGAVRVFDSINFRWSLLIFLQRRRRLMQ